MAIELESRVCYFTFGRFQPPTIGHKENFLAVKKAAKGHDYRIYISQTVDKKGTNPLDPDTKLKYMIKMIKYFIYVILFSCNLLSQINWYNHPQLNWQELETDHLFRFQLKISKN